MTNGTSQALNIILAIIIFGIFCIIAYSLFGDKMKTGLSDIFGDSLEQAQKDVNDDKTINVNADDEIGEYLYFKIRDSGKDEKGVAYTDVWVKGKKNSSDGTLTIVRGESDKTTVSNNKQYDYGITINGGSITIPDTVTGKDGTVYKITTIGGNAFYISNFTGDFTAPNVTTIGADAFYFSKFTGEFNAPNLTKIVYNAFYISKFTGEFKAPKVTTIDNSAFYWSKFTGEFNAPNLTKIGVSAFINSTFTVVNADKLTKANVGTNNGNISALLTK